MTELVVDDTPSPPVTGSVFVSVLVCVCPFTAGITGQGCMWSEAGRQLVEWDASVAGGYKVSFQRHTRDHPVPLTLRTALFVFNVKAAFNMTGASRLTQQGVKQRKMPRAQC